MDIILFIDLINTPSSPIRISSTTMNYSSESNIVITLQRFVHCTYYRSVYTFLLYFLLLSIRSGSGNMEEANNHPNHSVTFRVNS